MVRGIGIAALFPGVASAHGFGRLYNLPVPLSLYATGAAAVLLLSFVLIGLLALRSRACSDPVSQGRPIALPQAVMRYGARVLQLLGVTALLLSIATAFWGTRDPSRNFSMVGFWIIFVLGVTYACALVGNVYALMNPWRGLANGLRLTQSRLPYPRALGQWPAVVLYLGFVWYELFAAGRPFSLGVMLTAYTLLTLAGCVLFGARVWLAHGEFFGVFLGYLGRLAPLTGAQGRLMMRAPLSGTWSSAAVSPGAVVFILAMIWATAFDGLRATQIWVALFWRDPYGVVTNLIGTRPMLDIAAALPWYRAWETAWLLLGPFLLLGLYRACLYWGDRLAGHSEQTPQKRAAYYVASLLPIALVYHLAHYATLLLSDGLKILSVVSDPFGLGWNLFGTAGHFRAPVLIDVAIIWHLQVALIVTGHVASAYCAHRIASNTYATRGQALRSQLPLLILMIAMTICGLWILSQPLTAERMT